MVKTLYKKPKRQVDTVPKATKPTFSGINAGSKGVQMAMEAIMIKKKFAGGRVKRKWCRDKWTTKE